MVCQLIKVEQPVLKYAVNYPQPNSKQSQQIELYLRLLENWNRVHNLSSRRQADQFAAKHEHEPLALQPLLSDCTLYDVGAGAGAIGIVSAIMQPQRQVILVEKSTRKCAFLHQCRHELKLDNLDISQQRVEAMSTIARPQQIVTRAFASLELSMRLMAPLLAHPQTRWLALKGAGYKSELEQLQAKKIKLLEVKKLSTGSSEHPSLALILETT